MSPALAPEAPGGGASSGASVGASLAAEVAVALTSGALYYVSTGANHFFWPLAWIAPLPLLVWLPGLRAGQAALLAFAASAMGALNLVVAYRGLPPLLLGLVVLRTAVPFMLVALAWRAIARRSPSLIAAVAFPALATSVEYLLSLISIHGTFGSLAYSQADVTTVIQLASLTGLPGITFMISLVPAALWVAWRGRRDTRLLRTGLGLAVMPLVLVVGFGASRLARRPPDRLVRVGLAANDASVRQFDTQDPAEALSVVSEYAARARALADRGAQVIVFPEKFVGITPEYDGRARTLLEALARERHLLIVAGFNALEAQERRNLAVVFGPEGDVVLEYDKMHFLPGVEEGYRQGRAIGLVPRAPVPLGVAICKDLDFVSLGRAYAQAGTGLLLVPAWDFVNDAWLHSRMAVLRGVEGGFALARSAAKGFLTVSDARGRILAERPSDGAAEALLVADVPVGPGGTLYSRTGDWFAGFCLALTLGCGARALWSRLRPRSVL